MCRSIKKIIMMFIALTTMINVSSCSEGKKQYDDDGAMAEIKGDVFTQEIFQFNNVFTYGRVFEDDTHVYFTVPIGDEMNNDIKRIDKETGDVENLNIIGYRLNVYKNYLYYAYQGDLKNGEVYYLYRINLGKLDDKPELVLEHLSVRNIFIANDLIYYHAIYPPPIFSIDLNDFSQTMEKDIADKYYIHGIDEEYRYIMTRREKDDGYVYAMARCLHGDTKFENREYLAEAGEYWFNYYLVINNGFAYYCLDFYLFKCELKAGAESEIIYEVDWLKKDRFNVIAVTDDGIYIKKLDVTREPPYDNCIYRLDHNGENETALDYPPDVLYYVSIDGRLKYIKDSQIYSVE